MSSIAEQNAILTDVSPGSPMHQAMARYWLPACLSRDLPRPDSDPLRLTLLCRELVAFRDSSGQVGVLDEHCCHRSASLCLGRVEEGGIRCLYHGWKYDTEGKVLDMPNVRDERIKARIRQPAYPVFEAGGLVWVYLGPPEHRPPVPDLAVFKAPETHRFAEIATCRVNYTQLVEGVLDSSHVGVLHRDVVGDQIAADSAPDFEVQDTDFGFRYAALRQLRDEAGRPMTGARISAFAFPSGVYVNGPEQILLIGVPVTTGAANFVMIFWHDEIPIGGGDAREALRAFYGIDDEGLDRWGLDRRTNHLPDRPRRENNFLQDREKMRSGVSFSGMHRFIPEDFGIAASMGAVLDRTREHLVGADRAIVHYRRRMVENALAIVAGGTPVGLAPRDGQRAQAGMTVDRDGWKSWFGEPLAEPV